MLQLLQSGADWASQHAGSAGKYLGEALGTGAGILAGGAGGSLVAGPAGGVVGAGAGGVLGYEGGRVVGQAVGDGVGSLIHSVAHPIDTASVLRGHMASASDAIGQAFSSAVGSF